MKCQYVKWIDSETADGWIDAHEICSGLNYAHTVGFLVTEDESFIVMALSYDPANDQVNGYIKIPKAAVKDRRTVCQIKT